jgi:glucose-6-phosphate 1-dehydrogenase
MDNSKSEILSIVVLGASGDLAKKKTFPSLFYLYCLGLLPENFRIVGFARSKLSHAEFKSLIMKNVKGWEDKRDVFLSKCFYLAGKYDSEESFSQMHDALKEHEKDLKGNRIFYMAIPPSVFVDVAKSIRHAAMSQTGWNRIVVEKPFGKDSESSSRLSKELGALFTEEQIYRIDHYLGKEMVQNMMTIRFANGIFEPLWNFHHIANISITFKEDIGTDGRGGYFDEFGIIRDIMQNHLFQILSLVAMEPPVSLSAEDVRDEKVKVLRSCEVIQLENVVLGQYGRDPEGKNSSYLEDPTVPKDSLTATFATAIVKINNQRWKGVPFILKCGKALNERKTEIRIQFKPNPAELFQTDNLRNELVIRVQPNEALYLKFNAKEPGLSSQIVQTELDLTYKARFDVRLPDAYERLIYDVIRGDHNLFVRVDELDAAWKVFTPLLKEIETKKVKPEIYPFGSRGPAASDQLTEKVGFRRTAYTWSQDPRPVKL